MAGRGSAPGERRGGRQKGTPNKERRSATRARGDGKLLPLDYLLQVMRDPSIPRNERVDAAKAAGRYVHATIASVEVSGKDGGPIKVSIAGDDVGLL